MVVLAVVSGKPTLYDSFLNNSGLGGLKIMTQIIFAVLAVFILFPEAGLCSAVVSDSRSWGEKELQKRQPISEKWISSLGTIAKNTNHPGIQDISHFLRWESAIVVPQDKKGAPSAIHIDDYPNRIGILPLLKEDYSLNESWNNLGQKLKGARALYLPGLDPVILIQDIPITETWRGINLLHEGIVSAEILEKEKTADPKNFDGWLQERAEIEDSAWGTIVEAMQLLGGRDYQRIVASEVARLQTEKILSPESIKKNAEALNMLFGEPLSSFESDLRETALWVSAVLEIIEKENPDPLKAQGERVRFFYVALKNKRL